VLVTPFYRRRPEDFDWNAMTGLHEDFVNIMDEGIRAHARRPIEPALRTEMARRVCERVGPYGWTRFFETYLRTPWLRTDLIRVPALVVTGGRDGAVAEARDLADDLPHGSLELEPSCGHFPMIEKPGWFTKVLSRFLDHDPNRFAPDRRELSTTVGATRWMR
jgi:pimeloyl-ACP methyl ester carboxylesterase